MTVDRATYLELQKELEELNKEQKDEINAAVAVATNSLKAHHVAEIKLKDAENLAKEAQNKAMIESLSAQLTSAKSEAVRWETALNEQRKAETERSKSNAIGTISVGTGNNR